jgi:hypothetical protein
MLVCCLIFFGWADALRFLSETVALTLVATFLAWLLLKLAWRIFSSLSKPAHHPVSAVLAVGDEGGDIEEEVSPLPRVDAPRVRF